MLLAFRFANYRSFRDERVLRLNRSERNRVTDFPEPDVAPAAAIFGPNASGKSNLLRALTTMFEIIRHSASQASEPLPYAPYLLSGPADDPSLMEASVRIGGVRYDYGFRYTAEAVRDEWLHSWPKGRQRTLYERHNGDEWYFGDSLTGGNQTTARATRADALFLSTAKLLNHETLSPVYDMLAGLLRTVNSVMLPGILQATLESLSSDSHRSAQVTTLLTRAELGVVALRIEEDTPTQEARETHKRILSALLPDATADEIKARVERNSLAPQLEHSGASGPVPIPFEWESLGTRNFLALLGPILDRLQSGGVLIVDEIDTSLHPRLVSELVRLFQSPHTNPHQAQLVLSTHDVTIMMNAGDYNVLERDQLWFVEKNDEGVSDLYPLSDFSPRRAEVFSRNYLTGKYGAVPLIAQDAFRDLWSIEHRD